MIKCPECQGLQLDKSSEGLICRDCGLVIDDFPIEDLPDLNEGIKSRAEEPSIAQAGTLGIDGKVVKRSWLLSTREKNMIAAKKKIDLISSKLKLPEIVSKEAYLIFTKVVQKNMNVGRDNVTILYACAYASCIIHGIPKTALEITAFSEVRQHKMLKVYQLLKKNILLNVNQPELVDYIPRFASKLNLKPSTTSMASEILINLKDSPIIAGKNPRTIIATVLYIASKNNDDYRTQRQISNATGVIEVTIRKRSREIQLAIKQ